MTDDTPGTAPRANLHGDPCPSWCITDHAVYETHMTGRMNPARRSHPVVRLVAVRAARPPWIGMGGCEGDAVIELDEAGNMARLLEELADEEDPAAVLRALAAEVRAAAEIAGER